MRRVFAPAYASMAGPARRSGRRARRARGRELAWRAGRRRDVDATDPPKPKAGRKSGSRKKGDGAAAEAKRKAEGDAKAAPTPAPGRSRRS